MAKPRVRERIFRTACELFYQRGIRAVGVDSIACEAGTNKMSFYRNFASKDELVAEYLRDEEREGWAWWENGRGARRRRACKLEALFDRMSERMRRLERLRAGQRRHRNHRGGPLPGRHRGAQSRDAPAISRARA